MSAAERRCLTGLGCDSRHRTEEQRQRISARPIRLFWNINHPRCLQQKPENNSVLTSPTFFVVCLFLLTIGPGGCCLEPNASSTEFMPHPPPVPHTGAREWVSPLLCQGKILGQGSVCTRPRLWRASQTYAMQLCSIMGDQHLHNLYPSYSFGTNQMLLCFFFLFQHESPMNNL